MAARPVEFTCEILKTRSYSLTRFFSFSRILITFASKHNQPKSDCGLSNFWRVVFSLFFLLFFFFGVCGQIGDMCNFIWCTLHKLPVYARTHSYTSKHAHVDKHKEHISRNQSNVQPCTDICSGIMTRYAHLCSGNAEWYAFITKVQLHAYF